MPDITEAIDEYCLEVYGHTNWGYTSTYSEEELSDAFQYDYEINKSIVIWHKGYEEEE